MSHNRNLKYLNDRRIVYRRHPITDQPDQENEVYMFYLNGTYECYELFRSSAKITTYKSLKWHLLVLWYLNPQLDQDDFMRLAEIICNKQNGFISFNIHDYIGARATFTYFEKTKAGSYRHPLFKCIRNYE